MSQKLIELENIFKNGDETTWPLTTWSGANPGGRIWLSESELKRKTGKEKS
ncbi:unnamed protein product [marine sediment metagenome]|uniref:Uncharacterized protein n=1 Tax=marine sediment metagenome TaxID=412755 RepID=X1KH57_9ZZZZ